MSLLSSRAGSVDPQLAMPVPAHLERIVYYYESVRTDFLWLNPVSTASSTLEK
jgi:hypothetical protein